jgi:hypothetical protein
LLLASCAQGTTRNGSSGGGSHGSDADAAAERDASVGGDGDTPGDGDHVLDAGDGDGDSPDAGSTGPDAGDPEPMCEAVNGCFAATSLGQFNGDEAGQPALSKQGSGSAWFSARIYEISDLPASVSMRVTLTGDVGSDYDLYVYIPGDANATECSTPTQQSSTPGTAIEQVDAQWNDSLGSDDTRTVSIEVRHVSGACGNWSLQVTRP